ncbi:hypothetical protein G9A89_005771 [Geosiphon pyriformis]|nr:hypothetical protein G9A89_005771 [Geosiphon pyriformis]
MCLPHDFSSEILHHLLLYGLKSFEQVQSESKLAAIVLEFANVQNNLYEVWSDLFEVYTDGLLKNAGSAGIVGSVAVYFLALDMCIGVKICGLVSFTMTELQAVALFLKCVLSFCFVVLHFDSQVAIDACMPEVLFAVPDFCN